MKVLVEMSLGDLIEPGWRGPGRLPGGGGGLGREGNSIRREERGMFQPREYTESEGEEEAWSFQELQVGWKATPGPCRLCAVRH